MGFFSRIFSTKERVALGIDIGTSAIKLVELRKSKGKAVLSTYGSLALGPYSGLEVGRSTNLSVNKTVEALTDILQEAKTKTRKGGIAIPFSSSLMSLVELPNLDQKQLESMIPIEARKYIPVPINEITLDWSIVPRTDGEDEDEAETVDVMLVAIHNEMIKRLQNISQKTPLDTDFYEIEIFSTLRAANKEASDPVMVVDMGSSSTKVFIVERGAVRESHTINKGSQNLTLTLSSALQISVEEAEIAKRENGLLGDGSGNDKQAEALKLTLDYIFNEISQLQTSFEKENNKTIKNITLVGGGSALKGFIDIAKEKCNVPVTLADPFSGIEAPEFIRGTLKEIGPEFAVAYGLAIRALRDE